MSIDRLLTSVLRLYQDVHDDARTEQIFATTTTLLTNLSNPLNVSLLTSQLLTAPAIWSRGDGMRACYRIISIYNTAAVHVRRRDLEDAKTKVPRPGGSLRTAAWAAAVIKGADDNSSRWKHVLVLSGILMGLEGGNRQSLGSGMRGTLERAVVTAANVALGGGGNQAGDVAPAGPLAMALNYAFPLLSESSRSLLDCDGLVPAVTKAIFGADGLQDGLFLSAIDLDVRQTGQRFMWPDSSPSFLLLRQIEQKPLVSGLGPLSVLLGFAIQHARHTHVVLQAQDDMILFTERLLQHWQANKLSELEMSEEGIFLTPETLQSTWTVLWQLLKKTMYGVVAVLQPVVARSLLDAHMRSDIVAPVVATKSLTVLRNLYFISSRNGSDAFQVYTFTYLTSLDNLSRYADASAAFLQGIRPATPGAIPPHPLHRTLDLFYLDVAEHLPLRLPPETCDALIVQPAIGYLTHTAPLSPRMMELFEAAHSAVLSVLSCPHNAPITVDLVPFYAETLFSSFPSYISPRQFRVAFKTVMQILSPPFPISASHPYLAETLLEMVRFRTGLASKEQLPRGRDEMHSETPQEPASEQSTLVLTLIDALPFLHLSIFEEWMTLTALAVSEIGDPLMREPAKRRFWEVLSSGEMDVERAAIGVAWWGTKGGREAVLYGTSRLVAPDRTLMSGAIVSEPESRNKL
ncbi:putative PEX8 peroxisomal biogenesis factor 8 [Podospora aff. communis PSN243]|uniref:PEX8 peroxisomal biogenesis factor 8 n=1 Tax=Podospora aff. communis PSN243 TaxID=3040156 RepID=A0AAV9H502_9PEZI|nr:putative PEX8 peroxisomal biogenesis factor 8 [Podospora aff. communis PSN243]